MTRRSGFTLIELLVVISIISLLIAILLPALSAARKSAQSMACLSNEKQVMLANLIYSEENQERLPPLTKNEYGGNGNPDNGPLDGPWFVRLKAAGILGSLDDKDRSDPAQNALQCPNDVEPYSWADYFASYGLSNFVSADLVSSTGGISSNVPNSAYYRANAAGGGPRISQVKRASEVIAGGEPIFHRQIEVELPNVGWSGASPTNDRNWEWSRHSLDGGAAFGAATSGSVANAFYMDGHAATLRHDGVSMVGIKEVASNADIPTLCRMFVY